MQSARDIKQRIASVRNTQQITKAMEVVSATKMRRSQDLAIRLRPFASNAFRILAQLGNKGQEDIGLMKKRSINRALLVVITSDKGLAGSLNANVLRKATQWIKEKEQQCPIDIITIGRKAKEYFLHRSLKPIKEYTSTSDFGSFDQVAEISNFLQKLFEKNEIDAIYAIYTNFKTTLKQEAVTRQLLPLDILYGQELLSGLVDNKASTIKPAEAEYTLEPSKKVLFDTLMPFLFQLEIYHAVLESNASEHSARMVAMKTASDNASEIINELTLAYNKSRQAGITQELIEITSGASGII